MVSDTKHSLHGLGQHFFDLHLKPTHASGCLIFGHLEELDLETPHHLVGMDPGLEKVQGVLDPPDEEFGRGQPQVELPGLGNLGVDDIYLGRSVLQDLEGVFDLVHVFPHSLGEQLVVAAVLQLDMAGHPLADLIQGPDSAMLIPLPLGQQACEGIEASGELLTPEIGPPPALEDL